jgi:hypothetical protein
MTRLANVNTTDIASAIELGCRTMSNAFDADDDDRPFFESTILPEAKLAWNSSHSEAHVPGRHLNALLNAEDVLGLTIDERAVENHRRAAFYSYSGPVPLPLNRERKDGRPVRMIPHNVREGFHALYSLVKYRGDPEAQQLAEDSIAWILAHWDARRGWDEAALSRDGLRLVQSPNESFIIGLGRAIGPLVKYYRATGHGPALELAETLAEKACGEYFLDDGAFDPSRFGTHTHSTTCVMSGLAQLAELLDVHPLLARVKAFYDNGLWQIRNAIGWVIEATHRQHLDADVGEVNNTGDIVETALILGAAGYARCYADAKRILRCHLLPAQVRDTSFIHDGPNPANVDGHRKVAERHLGAFGFPTPYGHLPPGATWLSFNMDIVGGAVGSLCEVLRHAIRANATGIHVNLLFDVETDDVQVESPYTTPALRVRVKRQVPLWVRLPPWADVDRNAIRAQAGACQWQGECLFLPAPPVGVPIEIAFPLTEHELVLHHRMHDIRVRIRGDSVRAMQDFGAELTFFEPM